jgi:choline oxidase
MHRSSLTGELAAADAVIVGGGASGAVLARRLADAGQSVVLLEAGPSDERRLDVLLLRDWLDLLLDSEISVPYPVEPQAQANSELVHSRGRILGGSSSHNACIALRAPDEDLERWQNSGAPGWGPAGTAAAWERVLGTVAVTPPLTRNPLACAVVEAGGQAGLPLIESWGRGIQRGIGWLPLNVREGIRQSSSVAYLHPLAELPPNLTVLTESPAVRVEIDADGRAAAVHTDRGRVLAHREIVLCAGAFETPKLLMLSGVGPAQELRAHGITPLVDLPAVGEHLIDHPQTLVTWEATRPVPDEADSWWEVGLFADTRAGLSMSHVGMKPVVLPDGVPPAHGLSITPNVPYSCSEGRVSLRSADPAALPRVDPRQLCDPDGHDVAGLLAGLALAREVASQEALAPWLGDEVLPGDEVVGDRLERYVRDTASTVHHPAGTCRMGDPSSELTVVDPQLRVRGVQGLRVADASIFPSPLAVNPCLTCMMIGERAAELMCGR